MDDDDYCGPGYLAELRAEILRGDADAFHKGIGFVRFDDGLYLFDNQKKYYCLVSSSLTVRTAVAPDFPEISGGEEIEWTRRLRARGARERTLPPWGFVYDRRGDDHAYTATRVQFLRAFGPALRIGEAQDAAVDRPFDTSSCEVVPRPTDAAVFEDLGRLLATERPDWAAVRSRLARQRRAPWAP